MADVAAIILAAGGSSRLGRAKQLEQFGGRSLVRNAVAAAVDAGCRPIVVVTGSESGRIAADVTGSEATIVENSNWREGVASSIRIGIDGLRENTRETGGVVLMTCDQPFVTGKVVSDLINQWRKSGKLIIASSYSGTLGVPALFDRACFDELLQLQGDIGAKPIILKDLERVAEVSFPEGVHDVDTKEESARIGRTDE